MLLVSDELLTPLQVLKRLVAAEVLKGREADLTLASTEELYAFLLYSSYFSTVH